MILIEKNGLQSVVSRGAYKSIFKGQGWAICEDTEYMPQNRENSIGMNLPDPDYEGDTQDEFDQAGGELDEEDLTERPLSSLSLEELKSLADLYEIDTEDLHTKREYKAAIREYMERG